MSRIYTSADFEDAPASTIDSIQNAQPSMSYWKSVWHEFRKNRLAMGCLVILLLLVVMCIAGPMVSQFDYITNDYTAINQAPDAVHWFGTDALGRDLWCRVWRGGRISLIIALFATIIPKAIGMIVGGISGYFGGIVDTIIMRIIDILMGIPNMVYMVLFSLVLGGGTVMTMIVVLTLIGWMGSARMTRGLIIQIRNRDYVRASEALGISPLKIICRHLIPNTMGITLVSMVMSIPNAIYMEATLSFIGLGVLPPTPTWGQLVTDATDTLRYYPYQFLIPCILLTITMLCCHLLADGLRDALNPKSRS